jgi:fibronectin-binding autotransporter adhesin
MRTRPAILSSILVLILAAASLHASTYTWTNKMTALSWADASNWDGGGPFVSGSTNELRFFPDASATWRMPTGSYAITNVPAALLMNRLTLNGQGPNSTAGCAPVIGDTASTWTIGDGATATITQNASAGGGPGFQDGIYFDRYVNYTIGADLTLNQTNTIFTGNGGGVLGLIFSGNIVEGGSGHGITKSGNHLLIVSGTNAYSGTTTLNGGTLRLLNAASLPGGTGVAGGSSALTINGGVLGLNGLALQRSLGTGGNQLQITGGNSGFSAKDAPAYVSVNDDPNTELVWGSSHFNPNQLILSSSKRYASLRLANDIDLNGATRTVQANSEQSRAGSAILSGDIRGTGGLTKSGSGPLVLSGASTYTGPTTISGGTLSVGSVDNLGDAAANLVFNNGTLRITGNTLTNFSGIGHTVSFTANKTVGVDIDDPTSTFTVDQALTQGTGGFSKYGEGTALLNQTNTYSGNTTVSGGGTLVLDYSSQDNAKISSGVLSMSGGALILRGGTHAQTVSQLTLGAGLSSISRDGGSTATINLNAISGEGLTAGLALSGDGIATTDQGNAPEGILGGWATVSNNWAKNSTGGADGAIVGLTAGDYTDFVASGGDRDTNYSLTGSTNVTGGYYLHTLRIANSADSDVLDIGNNSLNFSWNPLGGLLYAGGANNSYTITGTGGLFQHNGNQPLLFTIYTGTLTVNCRFKSGGNHFAKNGAGTMVAGADNNYSGTTYVNQGVFRLATDAGAGAAGGGIVVQPGAALELTNSITVGAEALTITGNGVSGGGVLRSRAGTNNYGGKISVRGYGARINSDSDTLTLTGDILSAGKNVTFGGAGNITLSNTLVRAGSVTKDGTGKLGLVVTGSANQWLSGDMTLNESTLQFTFNEAPSESESVVKVLGDLIFDGTPTIEISADPAGIAPSVRYPLLAVSGTAPSTAPQLQGVSGTLKWAGAGNKTLYWDTSPSGSVLFVK